MRISTVNVNGIRAAARKGMDTWLQVSQPEILLLQEVRADADTAAALLPDYRCVFWPCRIKGRAGVGVALKRSSCLNLGSVRRGVAGQADEPDVDSGRWLEVDLLRPDGQLALTVISAYLHSGQVGTEKMTQKYAHLNLVDQRLEQLLASARANQRKILVAGDFNIVRSSQDIKNWRPNHNKIAGVLDAEIAHLEAWFSSGWVDVVRALEPQTQGPYTWWSQRGKAFDNNAGWRIDYQICSPALAQSAKAAVVERAASYEERWSDHAPLTVEYED